MMENTITITTLEQERRFTEYHRRRGEIRDSLRYGVFPNLVRALALYNAFVTEYGPGGLLYDAAIWGYYLENIKPIAAQQQAMIDAAQGIVMIMEAVEAAAPGTFGVVPAQVSGFEPSL